MTRPLILISWIASLFFALLSFSSLVTSQWIDGLSAAGIAALLLPPISKYLQRYVHRFVRYSAIAVLGIVFIVGLSSSLEPSGMAQDQQQGSSASSEVKNDPEATENVLSGIEDISVEIFDAQGRMGSKAQPPIEIIVQSSVNNCFDAKVKLFDVMKAIYTDRSLQPSLGRVVFNAPPFLRATLDAKDGYELSAASWKSSGPSNFYDVLKRVHDGDGGDLWQTWLQTLSGCL